MTSAPAAAMARVGPGSLCHLGGLAIVSTPTTQYMIAIAKIEDSTPSTGRSTKVATNEPHIAPAVFVRVKNPAVRVSSATSCFSASPMSVKIIPDRRHVPNVRHDANQRIRCHCEVGGPLVRN